MSEIVHSGTATRGKARKAEIRNHSWRWKRGPTVYWFCERPSIIGFLWFTEYKQCITDGWRFGFVRRSANTMLVDLGMTPEQLLASFKSRTRSVIRQAERLGTIAEIEPDHQHFLTLYNQFAERRGLSQLRATHALASPSETVITKAVLDGQVLIWRGYLADKNAGRVRNLVNATIDYPPDDRTTPRLAGMAHRYLVYADMVRFRQIGYTTYDFGGYAVSTDDPKLLNINRFKDSFRGRIVSEPNYCSWPLHAALAVRKWTKAMSRIIRLPTSEVDRA